MFPYSVMIMRVRIAANRYNANFSWVDTIFPLSVYHDIYLATQQVILKFNDQHPLNI